MNHGRFKVIIHVSDQIKSFQIASAKWISPTRDFPCGNKRTMLIILGKEFDLLRFVLILSVKNRSSSLQFPIWTTHLVSSAASHQSCNLDYNFSCFEKRSDVQLFCDSRFAFRPCNSALHCILSFHNTDQSIFYHTAFAR